MPLPWKPRTAPAVCRASARGLLSRRKATAPRAHRRAVAAAIASHKGPGRKPTRNPDWPGDVVSKPPKHRPPYTPPTRIVEDVPGWQVIQRSSRQFQPSGNNNRIAQLAPYRRAPGGMPPAGEARFVPDQVLCVLQGSLTDPEIERFLQQNRLAHTAKWRATRRPPRCANLPFPHHRRPPSPDGHRRPGAGRARSQRAAELLVLDDAGRRVVFLECGSKRSRLDHGA